MSEPELIQTVERAAADLAASPLKPEEAAQLARRLADLLAGIRALDDLGLEKAEPATVFRVMSDE